MSDPSLIYTKVLWLQQALWPRQDLNKSFTHVCGAVLRHSAQAQAQHSGGGSAPLLLLGVALRLRVWRRLLSRRGRCSCGVVPCIEVLCDVFAPHLRLPQSHSTSPASSSSKMDIAAFALAIALKMVSNAARESVLRLRRA